MARRSWLDAKADHPLIQERADKLKTFTDAISDGVVTKAELAKQEERLVAAMKKAEPELNDARHAKMTEVLVELTAYNVMRLLHELQAERVRAAFEKR